jgi:ABC-type glutathione transport system ATPase component
MTLAFQSDAAPAAAVFGVRGPRHVIARGRVLMRDHVLTTIDEAELRHRLRACRKEMAHDGQTARAAQQPLETGDRTEPGAAPAMVRIWNLHKSFGDTEVLKGVDLDVARGEVVTVIGPSGAGKSTLLSCINFLEPFEQGEITVDGEPVGWLTSGAARVRMPEAQLNRLRQRIGIVFQQFNLFPHLTVLQNVIEAPIYVKGMERERAVAIGREKIAGQVARQENAYRGLPAASSSGS